MARTSKVDLCLICEQVPCECGAPRKAKAPPKKQSKIESQPKEKASPAAAMKARAAQKPEPVLTPAVEIPVDDSPVVLTEDDQFKSAINALAPILHPDELRRFRQVVTKPDRRTLSDRSKEWRERVVQDH